MIAGARIRAAGWGWRHGGRRAWAVERLDLQVEPGERVLLLGASGSGKSTLLAALAGVLGGDEDGEERGRLEIDGQHPRQVRGRAGLVLQDPEAAPILARVGEDVAFGPENLRVPPLEIRRRVSAALAAVGLDVPEDRSTGALSGGQKQRLALAGVLAMGAGLLLLDEPTANLDPAGTIEVRDAIVAAAVASGATVVVVEHRVAVWADVVDRVVVLDASGAVLADGAPHQVLHAQAAALAARGVWVPGREPTASLVGPGGETLLETAALTVGHAGAAMVTAPEFALEAGTCSLLSGPNGAGKSTLALTVSGLLPPVSGRVRALPALAAGLGEEPIRWRSRELLTRIAMVFQSPQHQFLSARVRDELGLGLGVLRRSDRVQRVDELLERLGLAALADANPFTLSGGQQRRLSVGSALAASPRVLVLDEPTFGQDAVTWQGVVGLLGEVVAAGTAVLAATHDPGLLAATERRVVIGARTAGAS